MSNGEWRLSYAGEALVVSSGLVFYAHKKPKGLGLEDMLMLIGEHPQASYYAKRLKRRVTMGDALAQDKFQDLGKEVDMVSSVDLAGMEHDRVYKKLPKSGRQLLRNKYQSKPKEVTKVRQGG